MGVPVRNPEPMTADEFFAFTQTRPDEERWELIEGEPSLNASPARLHQMILLNLAKSLDRAVRSAAPGWEVLLGIGLRLGSTNVPVPDLLIRPADNLAGAECSDALVVFEILSPSTADRDLRWKRRAYADLASLQHYVVIAQDGPEVVVYDRASGFAERRIDSLAGRLDLPALGVSIPLTEIYLDTGLAGR